MRNESINELIFVFLAIERDYSELIYDIDVIVRMRRTKRGLDWSIRAIREIIGSEFIITDDKIDP